MHNLKKIKLFRTVLNISFLPALVLLWLPALLKKKYKTRHIFLFDRYALGGAQKVHLDILNSLADEPKLVLFTRFSPNDVLKETFLNVPNTTCKDIHFWCDNLIFRILYVHYISFYLNSYPKLHIFSSNSTFFYDLLPFLSKKHTKTELLHNFTYGNNGMEFFGLANYRHLDHRLCVDYATAGNIRRQYESYHIPAAYYDKVQVIEPGVHIPAYPAKPQGPLNVLYAGRGGPQKRLHLLNRIAEHCYEQNLPVVFHFAGNFADELSEQVKTRSVMYGEVKDSGKMEEIYSLSHIVLMTSAYEGFPMLIKEGMAHGCVPVVTALEGNMTHLTHMENALLIHHVTDEEQVVAEGFACMLKLLENQDLYTTLSQHAYRYAASFFDRAKFTEAYRSFFHADN